MNTDLVPDLQSHIKWFEKLAPNYYWVISVDDKQIGLINLADLDLKNCRTSFGFYIGEKDYWHCGAFVLPYFYDFVFQNFPVNKIIAEVWVENVSIRQIHSLHGFCYVGTFVNHIFKNNIFHNIIALELHKNTFDRSKWIKTNAEFER